MVLPVVWDNLFRGMGELDGQLLELARAYRFSWWKRVRLIYLPSLRPYFLSALTTSMGLAWKSGVAAEVLCLPKRAIGAEIYYTKLYLETPDLFAWTIVVVALSLLLEKALRLLLNRWKGGKKS
jgi:NitT/TauT family transport system permease protein